MSNLSFKLGADPEVFVRNAEGELVSAHGLVPGTKAEPHKVNCGAIQVDGMALEFNIDPASTEDEFVHNINTVIAQLKTFLPTGYTLDFSAVAHFGEEMIKAQPAEASELGCEPDYNAYTGEANPRPNADTPFRTASGHIHIGWAEGVDRDDPEHIVACEMMTQQLDYSLAPYLDMLDPDTTRRELYGQVGSYRPKSFGVEYRVPSNYWLTSEQLMRMVWRITRQAFNDLQAGRDYTGGTPTLPDSDIITLQRFFTQFERVDIHAGIRRAAFAKAESIAISKAYETLNLAAQVRHDCL